MNNNEPRNIREAIGLRLREERERLGLTQTEFATMGGASKRSITDWEQGKLYPNGEFLTLASDQGADINYIFTGERNISKLSHGEGTLLAEIRQLDESGKDGLIQYLVDEHVRRFACSSSIEGREQQRESQLVELFRQMSTPHKKALEIVTKILFRSSASASSTVSKQPGTTPRPE
jgi:transcriptional regulator with XRE-family HTH domain